MNSKRTNESINSNPNIPGKRVKFQDPTNVQQGQPGGDDLEFDLADPEETTTGKGRKQVVTDGYDSDSSAGSETDFGIGGGRKRGSTKKEGDDAEKAEDDDDDDDMFGKGDEAEEKQEKGVESGMSKKGKGKEKQYLDLGDIEGQEFDRDDDDERKGGSKEEEEEEEEEDYLVEDDMANDDDAPRSKRSKANMGYTLSSFNMQDELSEGRFSTDGSYVANAIDPLATHDVWLDGVSKSSIKAARESKKRMELVQQQKESVEAKGEESLLRERDDCLIGLLSIVKEGETVMRALARLGEMKRKSKAKKMKSAKSTTITRRTSGGGAGESSAMDVDETPSTSILPTPPVIDPITKQIDHLTHLASTLLSGHGDLEIYDQTYEDIMTTLKSEGAVRRDWVPARPVEIIQEEEEEEEGEGGAEEDMTMSEDPVSNRFRPLISRPTVSVVSSPIPSPTPPVVSALNSSGQFFYKWSSAENGQSIDAEYGPYGAAELNAWIEAGYFGQSGERVIVRMVGGDGFKSWTELNR